MKRTRCFWNQVLNFLVEKVWGKLCEILKAKCGEGCGWLADANSFLMSNATKVVE